VSPVAEVQARIADIEARIAAFTAGTFAPTAGRAGGVLGATVTADASATAASSAGFADVLSGSTSAGTTAGTVSRGARTLSPAYQPASATGEALLADAQKYVGVPYLWGGTTPKGFDCSGLIQYAAKEVGITLPRTAAQQATVGTEVPSLAQAKPGDLVVLENGHHIGIYVGNGQMLHAPKTGDVVKISKVWETPMTIRRLGATALGATAAAVTGATLLAGGLGATSPASASDYVRPASLTAGSAKSAPYDARFAAAEAKYGLPAGLLSAVAKQESGYDPGARSGAGAVGLMQFMPATARGMGIDPTDPTQAIDGAGRLLAAHLKRFGSVPLALAAYNAGAGNVSRYGGIPPFSETQNYVKKITATLGSTA